jgi:hypothetical protein
VNDVSNATSRTPLPAQLRIVGWPDPIIDRLGFPPHHPYSELVWLPATGPAATLAWRRLAQLLEHSPDGFDLDVAQFAQDLGLGVGTGGHSIISRTLRRLAMFELAIFVDEQTCAVRRRIPPAPARHLRRLSPHLRRIHTALLASHDNERLGRERAAESTSLRRWA